MRDELKLDQHLISLAMITILVEEDSIDRAGLCNILRAQWGHFPFGEFKTLAEFDAFVAPNASHGFRSIANVAFMALATDISFEDIRDVLEKAFDCPGARQLPEYREAVERFAAYEHSVITVDEDEVTPYREN